MHGWIDGCMDRGMNGWMDAWMDAGMDEWSLLNPEPEPKTLGRTPNYVRSSEALSRPWGAVNGTDGPRREGFRV